MHSRGRHRGGPIESRSIGCGHAGSLAVHTTVRLAGEQPQVKPKGFDTRGRAPTMTRAAEDGMQRHAAMPRRDERRRGLGPPPRELGQAEGLLHMLSYADTDARCSRAMLHRAAMSCWDERRRGRGPLPRGLGATSAVSSGVADWASLTESRSLKPDAAVAACEDQSRVLRCS